LNLGRDSDKRRKNYRELFKHHFSDTVLEQIRKATNKGMIVGNDRFREEIEALRAMEILKSTNRAPDFSLFSRRVNGRWNMYTLTQRGKQVKRQAVW
jgi:putative transposase